MKDIIKDIIKWGVIIVIGVGAFYVVCPKYEIIKHEGDSVYRYNKITGKVERWVPTNFASPMPMPGDWQKLEFDAKEIEILKMLKP